VFVINEILWKAYFSGQAPMKNSALFGRIDEILVTQVFKFVVSLLQDLLK
jgi:hypothetical protein